MTTKTKADKAKTAVLSSLGARIKVSRTRGGATQADLAEKLGISVAYLSLIERGGRNPPITTFLAIAHALDVPAGLLAGDD
jgi:transcriptional regulator with XRE-family HTH domain